MAELTQERRIAQFTTPLGKDALVITSFQVSEGLSELFQISVEALSSQDSIDFDQAIGRFCHIKVEIEEGKFRFFNGILTEARSSGSDRDLSRYSIVLRPWPWLLSHRFDCRIFTDKKVTEIIEDVFNRSGFGGNFEFRTTENYDVIPYCVQYRESDLGFVSRLMEENGIYFYFEHSDDRHVMVLADSLSSHKPNPDIPKIPLRPNRVDRDQCLYDWIQERRYSTGKFELNDYDYAKPFKKLIASKAASEKYEKADFEAYDYPGRYDDVAKGQKFAKFRLEAEQSFDRRRYSEGHAPSLFPGSLVTVELNPVASENATYLVIRCSYLFSGQMFETSSEGSRTSFRGSYEFLRSDQQFRALPTTPRPIIYGAQTATVVGKKGDENEEISTDKSGHVWVQFHWDREQQISCPIRVAQAWAGKRWGEIFIPRVGMEVVIEFLEGDPDRPLIVGCVYNGDMPPPYDLPDHKTKAGWKSDSTKGHGGYNEVVFEDRKGHEQIGVHAQKDLDVVVLANETRAIGSDLHTTIGNSEKREIGKNFKIPVGSASRQTVVKMGDDVLDVESGNIIHNAKLKIELQVGASKITIEPWGITIDAPMITLNGAGPVTVAGLPIKLN